MTFKSLVSALVLLWIVPLNMKGQDPALSQFYANPLYLNPALTGNTECARFNLNYRNQWPSISKAYVTYSASYDQNIPEINSGFGFMFMNDVQGNGIYSRSTIGAYYAYNLKISEDWVMSFGVKGAYYQEALSGEMLQFADQLNLTTGEFENTSTDLPEKSNINAVDFGTGVLFDYGNKVYVGFSADHLTEPDLSFYNAGTAKLPMKMTFHSGVTIN